MNGIAIDVTVIVDVDVGVVGVVVIVIVIVAVEVLWEQLLVVPSCPSPFPTAPLLCLVCKHLGQTNPRRGRRLIASSRDGICTATGRELKNSMRERRGWYCRFERFTFLIGKKTACKHARQKVVNENG